MDSPGFFTCIKYISCTSRPSARTVAFFTKKSFTGLAFTHFMMVSPSVVPVALTAFR
ncbi:hypothetical protein D3C72_2418170 [compost metagenome]